MRPMVAPASAGGQDYCLWSLGRRLRSFHARDAANEAGCGLRSSAPGTPQGPGHVTGRRGREGWRPPHARRPGGTGTADTESRCGQRARRGGRAIPLGPGAGSRAPSAPSGLGRQRQSVRQRGDAHLVSLVSGARRSACPDGKARPDAHSSRQERARRTKWCDARIVGDPGLLWPPLGLSSFCRGGRRAGGSRRTWGGPGGTDKIAHPKTRARCGARTGGQ